MTDKLSDRDKKDWQDFLNSSEKLDIKDREKLVNSNLNIERRIDLHGYTLEQANIKISEFIDKCFNQNVSKINVITGKGLRSKNIDDPYQSSDLSILKYSVPNFISKNKDLMSKISKIDYNAVKSSSKGSFNIILKKKL